MWQEETGCGYAPACLKQPTGSVQQGGWGMQTLGQLGQGIQCWHSVLTHIMSAHADAAGLACSSVHVPCCETLGPLTVAHVYC
jgi:hypothetical protein